MIIEKNLLDQLKHFGLNSYEAKLWTALLAKGVSTAGDLSDLANVPRSRSYDVLESLETKGFIVAKIGKPIQYIALSPQEVLQRVKKKINEEAERKAEQIENLKSTKLVKELDALHKQSVTFVDPSELSSLIHGQDNILTQFSTMIKNAEKSIKFVTTSTGFERKIKILKKNQNKLTKNVQIQAITQPNIKTNNFPSNIQLKQRDNITSRFCLMDGKEALFMLVNDNEVHPSSDTAIWIKSPFFVNSLNNLFDIAFSKP